MRLLPEKIQVNLLSLVFFLTFLGYYAIILIAFYLGLGESTQAFTLPTRFLIVILLLLLVFLKPKTFFSNVGPEVRLYLLFSAVFVLRVLYDLSEAQDYYMSYDNVLLYFFSFCFFPFIILCTREIKSNHQKLLFSSVLASGLIFSFLSVILFARYLGSFGRISTSIVGEAVLSPLALSYCSALIIGIGYFYLRYNRTTLFEKTLIIISIGLSIVPFFLGASRGALVALFVPLIISTAANSSFRAVVKNICVFFLVIMLLSFLDSYLESGLLERFLSIGSGIEQGDSSVSRIQIWESSLNQFMNNPIFGDKLRVDGWKNYPHNLFLEVLQTTGIFGFVPVVILILSGFKVGIGIFRHNKEYAWIAAIFFQALVQSMFSGALYTSVWLWSSLALLFALQRSFKFKTSK